VPEFIYDTPHLLASLLASYIATDPNCFFPNPFQSKKCMCLDVAKPQWMIPFCYALDVLPLKLQMSWWCFSNYIAIRNTSRWPFWEEGNIHRRLVRAGSAQWAATNYRLHCAPPTRTTFCFSTLSCSSASAAAAAAANYPLSVTSCHRDCQLSSHLSVSHFTHTKTVHYKILAAPFAACPLS